MLKLTKVNSYYDQLQVLWNVDIEVKDKTITGLIGNNGAGKSTLLKTILGVVPFSSGAIVFDGRRIDRVPTRERAKNGIVYVPEGRRVFAEMTVSENLNLGLMTQRAKEEKEENRKEVYELFPILRERGGQLAGSLSGGELQQLALGRGLMAAPRLLMIDEPSLGLSPIATNAVFKAIREINQHGKTILIVEQNVPRLLNLSSVAYVLENGHVVRSGPASSLEKDEYIIKSYLGI